MLYIYTYTFPHKSYSTHVPLSGFHFILRKCFDAGPVRECRKHPFGHYTCIYYIPQNKFRGYCGFDLVLPLPQTNLVSPYQPHLAVVKLLSCLEIRKGFGHARIIKR